MKPADTVDFDPSTEARVAESDKPRIAGGPEGQDKAPNADGGDSTQPPAPRTQKTVMVVEDNELNMKLFCDLLRAFGYKTIPVTDGRLAVDLVFEHRPDLIIMDIQLPHVSGLDIMRMIKGDDDLKHIPIVAVTAFAMRGDELRIREGGCDEYLKKPISVRQFTGTIKQLIG